MNLEILKSMVGRRVKLSATFVISGTKLGYQQRLQDTIRLSDITDTEGNVVLKYTSMYFAKGFQWLTLRDGDRVEFHAVVVRRWHKFKLVRPTKIRRPTPSRTNAIRLLKRRHETVALS